jgi:hypothetical protein
MLAAVPNRNTEPLTPPSAPGEWSLAQIQAALSRPLPKTMLATRKQGGTVLEYIPWHTAVKILDKYAPGWQWSILSVTVAGDRLVLTGRLTIPTIDGLISRDATGTEFLDCSSYGEPSSNSESQAFSRTSSKRLALYLYEK